MNICIQEPYELSGEPFKHQIFDFTVQGIDYWSYFSLSAESLSNEQLESILQSCGIQLQLAAYQFKFDRRDNMVSENYYEIPVKPELNIAGVKLLGLTISEIFKLHHELTGAKQYYAFALNQKLSRFYKRIAAQYSVQAGFRVESEIGPDGLGHLIQKE